MLTEHTDQLRKIIESCKALYDEFDVKRRDIKAEKAKRIRELTDPGAISHFTSGLFCMYKLKKVLMMIMDFRPCLGSGK